MRTVARAVEAVILMLTALVLAATLALALRVEGAFGTLHDQIEREV